LRWAHSTVLGYVDEPLVLRRIHGENIVRDETLRLRSLVRVLRSWDAGARGPLSPTSRAVLKRALGRALRMLGMRLLRNGEKKEARAVLKGAAEQYPWDPKIWAAWLLALLPGSLLRAR
jgi:hypothetical protein